MSAKASFYGVLGLVLFGIGFLGIGAKQEESLLATVCFCTLIIAGFALLVKAVCVENRESASRPIVHVWEHNGVTRVIPHIDWELWHQVHERLVLAEMEEEEKRPDPRIVMSFSDARRVGQTGSMDDYRKFVENCRVEKSESQVWYGGVSLEIAWKLVHGADSKPPEN